MFKPGRLQPARTEHLLDQVVAWSTALTPLRNTSSVAAFTLRVGQALADVATIALLQQRAIHHRDALTEQLQSALNSRILIEQAKGVLAERLHVDVAQAFVLLRQGARSHNRRLTDLAHAIVAGTDQVLPATANPTTASPPNRPAPFAPANSPDVDDRSPPGQTIRLSTTFNAPALTGCGGANALVRDVR